MSLPMPEDLDVDAEQELLDQLGVSQRKPSKTRLRERHVLTLRAQGLTFDVIADRLGYANRSGAQRAYQRAMLATGNEDLSLAEQRDLEVHRLDIILSRIWPAASRGDLAAVDRYARLSRDRVKLLGMALAAGRSGYEGSNRPGKHEKDGESQDNVVSHNALEALRAEREKRAAERAQGPAQ